MTRRSAAAFHRTQNPLSFNPTSCNHAEPFAFLITAGLSPPSPLPPQAVIDTTYFGASSMLIAAPDDDSGSLSATLSASSPAEVAGLAIGAALVLILFMMTCWFLCRKRRRSRGERKS